MEGEIYIYEKSFLKNKFSDEKSVIIYNVTCTRKNGILSYGIRIIEKNSNRIHVDTLNSLSMSQVEALGFLKFLFHNANSITTIKEIISDLLAV